MHCEAADDITPDRQQDAALEPALREFEPVYPGILQLRRQHAASADDEHSVFDHGHDLLRIDTGEGYQNQHLALGLQHVDRRLPTRLPRTGRRLQAEELLAQSLGARQRIDRLRQHPVDGISCRHLFSRVTEFPKRHASPDPGMEMQQRLPATARA